MDKDLMEWAYLSQVTGNFEGLYRYYFSAISGMAPAFRQTGVGLLYSIGLGWLALCALKSPVDRLKTAAGVGLMVLLAGFLISPTTNNKYLSDAKEGTELSVGGYYSFLVIGTLSNAFNYVTAQVMDMAIREFAGHGGSTREVITAAFNTESKRFTDRFVKGDGKRALDDYYEKCGQVAIGQAQTSADFAALRGIGLGSNNIGMTSKDQTHLTQLMLQNQDGQAMFRGGGSADPAASMELSDAAQLQQLELQKTNGIAYLKKLPPEKTNIAGDVGYRIPKVGFYQQENDSANPSDEHFEEVHSASDGLKSMLPPGATATKQGSATNTLFYPKNCYELYLVADKTMANLRAGVKDDPEFKDLKFSSAFVSASTANKARHASYQTLKEKAAQQGTEIDPNLGEVSSSADGYFAYAAEIGNQLSEWYLEFKLPAMIAGMALLVAVMVVIFPIFALLSVIFGYPVLVTYMKLMALPFLVVLANRLILSTSALMIHFDEAYMVVVNTFMPNSSHAGNALSAMTIKTVAYLLVCGAEITIAKMLLWNDVRSLGNVNLGKAATSSAEMGNKVVGFGVMVAATVATGGIAGAGAGAAGGAAAAGTAAGGAAAGGAAEGAAAAKAGSTAAGGAGRAGAAATATAASQRANFGSMAKAVGRIQDTMQAVAPPKEQKEDGKS